jgi:hypothetical protein
MPAVHRYNAIFWAFYELFMIFLIASGVRIRMPGSITHIALYALADGAVNGLVTIALFGFLDALSLRRRGGRMGELLALSLVLVGTVVVMITIDVAFRIWFDHAPAAAFSRYWLRMFRNQFHDSLLTVAFLAGLGNALRSWAAEEQRKIRESKLETAIARAGLAAVAARLRPDGVSDALREIGATVERDPVQARELTVQLADTLRDSFRQERPAGASDRV